MTKARNVSITVATIALSAVAITFPQSIHALEISISPNGAISFYDDGVLGQSTQPILAQANANRTIPSRAGNRIRLQATDNTVDVDVENKGQTNSATPTVQKVEEAETKRLRVQFPAQITEVHMQNLEADNELQKRTEYQRQLLENRRDRTDNVEVRSQLDDTGSQELEVQSKEAEARLKRAEFAVEPETNTVTITTPSGNVQTLNHLPDQALERIRERVALQNTDPAQPEFTIETNQEGELIYRAQGTKPKRFLGIFNRPVDAEVILNDETGEVTEIEYPSPGILGQFLDAFTF